MNQYLVPCRIVWQHLPHRDFVSPRSAGAARLTLGMGKRPALSRAFLFSGLADEQLELIRPDPHPDHVARA